MALFLGLAWLVIEPLHMNRDPGDMACRSRASSAVAGAAAGSALHDLLRSDGTQRPEDGRDAKAHLP
jgi:hypothetical protein